MLRKIRHIVGDHDQPGVEHRRALAVLVQLVGHQPQPVDDLVHQNALDLLPRVAGAQILHHGGQQRVIGRTARQLEVNTVVLHGHARRFHHKFVAAVQALQQLAVIQERTFVQIAGIRVDQIPAVVVGAADDVLNRQVAVDRAHRVLRKQVAQPVMVKHPVQRGQVLVLHAVDAQRVIAHQLAQHPVLMQLFQVAVNLRLDVLFDFFRVRRDRRRLVELILQRRQHRTQDGAALFHGVRVQVAEHPHGLRVVDHVVPAAAVGLLAAQNIAQRQAVLLGTQPVELLGQLCAVLAKGIFAVERRLRVHAEHRRGVRPGGVVLQNRNAAVHLQKPLDVVLVFQTEIPAQEHRAVMLVGLRQQVQVAFPGGGGLRGLVHRAAHALGQQRGRPHGQQRQHKPCQQQPAGRGGRRAQRTAGQQRGKVRGVAPEQQPEHIHQLHRLPGHGQRRRQRGVGAQIRRPHQQCIDDQPPDFHAA